MTEKQIILKNIFYLHRGNALPDQKDTDISIRGNKIESIGKNVPADSDAEIVDCSKHVVIPGLVNTHHHFYQTLTRNIPAVQNAKLFDWLVYLYEVWKNIDEEAVYISSQLAMAELLKTGCTTSTDHHYLYPNNVSQDLMKLQFEAADMLGMRFSPTRGSMSLSKKDGGLPPDTVVQTENEILEDSLRVIQQYHDSSELSMHKVVLAPCSPFSVTKELMRDSARLAREYKVRLHTHLAETRDENDFCEEIYGKRPLALMEECEFVGEDVFYAHGIHFNDNELDRIAQSGSQIAHCPSSNMRLGSGICRVKEMSQNEINVALAVDGSASNDSSDMLGEVRNALLLQRIKYGSDGLSAREAFKMGTENGAKLLNFSKVGKLKEGWAADLAIFNVQKLEYAGALSDPLAALIFSGYNHGADYTMVNGKFAVKEGKLVSVNEEELMSDANSIARKLLEEAE